MLSTNSENKESQSHQEERQKNRGVFRRGFRCLVYHSLTGWLTSASACHRFPPVSFWDHKKPWSPVILTNQLQIGSFEDSLLRFEYFARIAHRIQENRYLLDCWFIIKRSHSGVIEWRRWTGQDMGEGCRADMPSAAVPHTTCLPPAPAESSQNLLEFFMEASLHSHSWLNHWPLVINVQPLFLPWR